MEWFRRLAIVHDMIKNYPVQQIVIARPRQPLAAGCSAGFEYTHFSRGGFQQIYLIAYNEYKRDKKMLTWYESLTPGNPYYFYLDIDGIPFYEHRSHDWRTKPEPEPEPEKINLRSIDWGYPLKIIRNRVMYVAKLVGDVYKKVFNYDLPAEEIILLECARRYSGKVSYHVLYRTKLAFKDTFQLKYFSMYTSRYLRDNGVNDMKIDPSVYNVHQLFRLPLSSKTEDNMEIFDRIDHDTMKPSSNVWTQDDVERCMINAAKDVEVFQPLEDMEEFTSVTNFVRRSDEHFERFRSIFSGRLFGKLDAHDMGDIVQTIKMFENSPRTAQLMNDIFEAHLVNGLIKDNIYREGRYYGPTVTRMWGSIEIQPYKDLNIEDYLQRVAKKFGKYFMICNELKDKLYIITVNMDNEERGCMYSDSIYDNDVIITVLKETDSKFILQSYCMSKTFDLYICALDRHNKIIPYIQRRYVSGVNEDILVRKSHQVYEYGVPISKVRITIRHKCYSNKPSTGVTLSELVADDREYSSSATFTAEITDTTERIQNMVVVSDDDYEEASSESGTPADPDDERITGVAKRLLAFMTEKAEKVRQAEQAEQ